MHDPDISIALNVTRAIDLSVLQNRDLAIGISWYFLDRINDLPKPRARAISVPAIAQFVSYSSQC